MGTSEKQSGSCHLVTVDRHGGVFRVQLGGRQAPEVLIRMRGKSGSGLEAVWSPGSRGSSPLPPALSQPWPLHREHTASRPLD